MSCHRGLCIPYPIHLCGIFWPVGSPPTCSGRLASKHGTKISFLHSRWILRGPSGSGRSSDLHMYLHIQPSPNTRSTNRFVSDRFTIDTYSSSFSVLASIRLFFSLQSTSCSRKSRSAVVILNPEHVSWTDEKINGY